MENERIRDTAVKQTMGPQQLAEQGGLGGKDFWEIWGLSGSGKVASSTHSFDTQWLSTWHGPGTLSGSGIYDQPDTTLAPSSS